MSVTGTPEQAAATSTEIAVRLRGIAKRFTTRRGEVVALEPTDLDIGRGEFLCVVGPSGCGKTTLLNIVGDLVPASQGVCEFMKPADGRPLLAVVFQEESIYPWLTALDNAAFGLMARGVKKEERRAIAHRLLVGMGLGRHEHAYPHELSGGMRQRVNLARAFATDPEILLMDEPFANLDEQTRLLLQDDLLGIWAGTQKTVIFITHSIDEAIRLADRVIVMTARPGRIKANLEVNIPRPRDLFDPAVAGEVTQLRAAVWGHLREEVISARLQEEGADGAAIDHARP